MWKNEKSSVDMERSERLLAWSFYIFLFAIIGITVWIWTKAPTQRIFSDLINNDVWFGDDWHYVDMETNTVLEDVVNTHRQSYLSIETDGNEAIIQKKLDKEIAENDYFIFRTSADLVKVYVNNWLWYEKEYDKVYKPYTAKMYMLHQISADGMRKGDTIRIELCSEVSETFIMQFVTLGDRYRLMMYIVKNSKNSLIVCALAAILLVLNVIAIYSDRITDKKRRMKALRWTCSYLLVSIVYVGMDSGCMDIFSRKMAITNWLSNISLMMMPMPFIMYTQNAFFPGHRRYEVLSTINFLLVVFGVIGYIYFAFDLSDAVGMVYLIIVTALLMCICSFIQEKERPPLEVFLGYMALIITTIISLICRVYILAYPGSRIFGYGMIVFSSCMLAWTVKNANEKRRSREEAELAFMKRDKEEAEEASAQKSRFLSHMSHEIRTPLNAVLGMNELIMRETQDEKIHRYAENIQSSGRTLLALINDVLDFSKIETGKMDIVETEYSLSSVLYDLILMVKGRARNKGLEFKIEVQPDIPDMLYGDEIRIKQVILNILTNAVKYTKEGWIELDVSMIQKEENPENKDISLRIQVSDTGMGIRKEDLNKLFTEFERLDRKKNRSIEGTGLGLSISSKLVDLMNGKIEVESEYQKGSTFVVTIPQRVVKPEAIGDYKTRFERMVYEAEHVETEQRKYTGKRVFVVDDNETNLEVIAAILEMFEIEVAKAGGAEEAIRMLDKEAFDLIMTDDMMPEVNGTELMKRIKSNKNGANYYTPVVVLTANAVVGAREEYIKIGFDGYMSKPIDIEILQKTLKKFLHNDI